MSSKKRITVNFADSSLYEHILDTAKKAQLTQSRVIETLVSLGTASCNELTVKNVKEYRKNQKLQKRHNAINKCTIRIAELSTSEGGSGWVTVTPSSFTLPFGFEDSLNLFFNVSNGEFKKSHLKETILHLCQIPENSRCFLAGPDQAPYPDFALIFISCFNVSFEIKDDKGNSFEDIYTHTLDIAPKKIRFHIDVSVTTHPIYLNNDSDNIHHYLDYKNVRYRTYKHIATQGWNTRRYTKYYHLEDTGVARGGGYFIGMMQQKNTLSKETALASGFKSAGYCSGNGFGNDSIQGPETFIKFFTSDIKMKFNSDQMAKLKAIKNGIKMKAIRKG